jgi:hypothetical protein
MIGLLVLIVCSVYGFLDKAVSDIEYVLKKLELKPPEAPVITPGGLPPWILKLSSSISNGVLFALPNLSDFDISKFILNDQAILTKDLVGASFSILPRVFIVFIIGSFLILFRDFI